MITIELDDDIASELNNLAEQEHISPAQLAKRLLLEYMEDWQDARAAEKALDAIEKGEDDLIDWEDVKAGLYDDMEN